MSFDTLGIIRTYKINKSSFAKQGYGFRGCIWHGTYAKHDFEGMLSPRVSLVMTSKSLYFFDVSKKEAMQQRKDQWLIQNKWDMITSRLKPMKSYLLGLS